MGKVPREFSDRDLALGLVPVGPPEDENTRTSPASPDGDRKRHSKPDIEIDAPDPICVGQRLLEHSGRTP
jgi:hypothetical protein